MSKPLACSVCALMFLRTLGFAWPLLSVSESNRFVTVSWPVSSPEFTLQATTNVLAGSNWFGITQGVAVNGGLNYFLTNAAGQNSLLFRLTRPCVTNDLPDALFADDNCDGIDGNIGAAVFVATNGVDTPLGGTMQSPFLTINYAIQRAGATGKSQVLIQAGNYSESVNLANGIGLYGGYDANWGRGPRTLAGHTVTILGGFNPNEQRFIALRAAENDTNQVADLVITGSAATTNGSSSYAVYVRKSSLTLERVTLAAGPGAPGQMGTNGLDAVLTGAQPYMGGANGGNAQQYIASCDSTSRGGGGAPGANGFSTQGGMGGSGGTMDTSCGVFPDFAATAGMNGANATIFVAPHGQGGLGGNPFGGPAQAGQNGTITNGIAGLCGNGYQLLGNYFFAQTGSAGTIGLNGGGGGGGGGSGGNDNGTDSYGAGGGGGGAGGLAARGGGGGSGGGSSFGIFAVDSTIGITNSTVTLGSGGNGGVGGIGGRGQSGGPGGIGGMGTGNTVPGGDGGRGGHGGHGGGGGGGQGGYSVGIALFNSNLSTNAVTFSGGVAGLGGQGGASAPTAPVGEQDGNPGQAGTAGLVANVLNL